ncbi:hypothetical protein MMC24_006432 [Lignoscripta atroalba]|nr:hypothetical protein [Lignoscripta atroalba]
MSGTVEASNLKEYHGNCHCGAFIFSFKAAELKQAEVCNCSICVKGGMMWTEPATDDYFVVEKGKDSLKDYTFGQRIMTHKVRTIRDIDLDALGIKTYDGASLLQPPYQPPKVQSHFSTIEEDLKVYDGSCHCGAVTLSVKSKPLTDIKVETCDCSICSRNGDIWIYPSKDSVAIHGEDALTSYSFAKKTCSHRFCGTCGVMVYNEILDPNADIKPINVRTLNGVDLETLKIKKVSGKEWDPQYDV